MKSIAYSALLLVGCAHGTTSEAKPGGSTPSDRVATASTPEAAANISPSEIEKHLRFLADDTLEGRAVATPGIERAAQYHEDYFRALGLEPVFRRVEALGQVDELEESHVGAAA